MRTRDEGLGAPRPSSLSRIGLPQTYGAGVKRMKNGSVAATRFFLLTVHEMDVKKCRWKVTFSYQSTV